MDAAPTGPGARGRPRPGWAELPSVVREGTEALLGARVTEARSVALGLSPGVATRLRLDDGRRVFLKASGVARGEEALDKLRREAAVLDALPPAACAPRLHGVYDDARWVAVVSDDVAGRPPQLPWRQDELDRVLAVLTECAAAGTPAPLPAVSFVQDWAYDLTGWRQLAGAPEAELPAEIDPWASRRRGHLAELETGWPTAAAGETLLHGDLRADNILLTGERVWLVDWASTSVGAPWLDLVFLLPSVALAGGPEPESVVVNHPLTAKIDPAALTAVVAALAGFLITVGMEPAPWYAPEVRRFQRAQGAAAVAWLRRRLRE